MIFTVLGKVIQNTDKLTLLLNQKFHKSSQKSSFTIHIKKKIKILLMFITYLMNKVNMIISIIMHQVVRNKIHTDILPHTIIQNENNNNANALQVSRNGKGWFLSLLPVYNIYNVVLRNKLILVTRLEGDGNWVIRLIVWWDKLIYFDGTLMLSIRNRTLWKYSGKSVLFGAVRKWRILKLFS